VPVFIESLYPAIAGLNRELATIALSLEHLGPVFLTVDLALFNMEAARADGYTTLHAHEAVHVERVLHGVHDFPDDRIAAFSAARGQELLVVRLAVELVALLHKADVNELGAARRVRAIEVIRAPGLFQRVDERTSDSDAARVAHGDASCSAHSRHALGVTHATQLHLTRASGDGRRPT